MKVLAIILLLYLSTNAIGQDQLNRVDKKEIIDSIASLLTSHYVFPDVADTMVAIMKRNLKFGVFATIQDKNIFADTLTSILYRISKDKHLNITYNSKLATRLRKPNNSKNENEYRFIKKLKQYNFGFEEVKVLDGNIGYLKITSFAPVAYGGETAGFAMNFIAHCQAIIFDIRTNFGGDPSMIQFLSSFLFSSELVHLNNSYNATTKELIKSWTLPYIPGKRKPNIPVYILTSKTTISAGEEFAYNLKHLKELPL